MPWSLKTYLRLTLCWIEVPNNEGYVRFDDWDTGERDDAIKSIERQLKASVKAQGERLGEKITFDGWRVYPTLNKEKGILYYATDLDWAGKKVRQILRPLCSIGMVM